jgi:hypothetical protein
MEVDDLVDAGDVDGAISLLESVSNLSTSATDLCLATALGELTGLHASRGDTLRSMSYVPEPSSSNPAP